MIKQTPGKIFLADQRGITETPTFRRYSTFNFGQYYNENKASIGNLYAFNEESLAGNASLAFSVSEPTGLLILPITGTVHLHLPEEIFQTIEVEEMGCFWLPAGQTFNLVNPYPNPEDVITYIHIWIKTKISDFIQSDNIYPFDLSNQSDILNLLIPKAEEEDNSILPFYIHLGKFSGRQEAIYNLKNSANLFFAFVLSGAFELEGRLLHEKDSLALWETDAVEIEALSQDAIILIIEVAS